MTGPAAASQPLLVLINETSFQEQNSMLEFPAHPFEPTSRPSQSDLRAAAGDLACAVQALRRPEATSEPSHSMRTSMEADVDAQQLHLSSPMASGRKLVQFEQRLLPTTEDGGGFGSISSFSAFAPSSSTDDLRIGREETMTSGRRFDTASGCALGQDSKATSMPLGALDSAVSAALAAAAAAGAVKVSAGPRLEADFAAGLLSHGGFPWGGQPARTSLQSPHPTNTLPGASPTAAQRLQQCNIGGGGAAAFPGTAANSNGRRRATPPSPFPTAASALQQHLQPQQPPMATPFPTPLLVLEKPPALSERTVSLPIAAASSTPEPALELVNDIGGTFGAHLVTPPRDSTDSAKPSSRGSLDLLLHGSTGTSPRHSLDSLQGLIYATTNLTPVWEGVPSSTEEAGATTASRLLRPPRQLPGSASAAVAAAAHRASLDTLSLDPGTSLLSGIGGVPASQLRAGPGLRSLADPSLSSITVVAEPMRPGAAVGPSVGALASSMIDHFSPEDNAQAQARERGTRGRGMTASRPLPMPTGSTGPPTTMIMDADLHDTFGAHLWYSGGNASPSPTSFIGANSGSGLHGSSLLGGGSRPLSSAAAAEEGSGSAAAASRRLLGCSPPTTTTQVTAKHLEPTAVPGQHSVTLHDAQCIVPSYDFLRQRKIAKQRQANEVSSGAGGWSGGYIAEAKRVLSEAMGGASRQEVQHRDSSYSGAIGPLLRLLRSAAGDEERSRSALHTLGLLVSNLPNRGIIVELEGRNALAMVMRHASSLDVREQAIQLLWDLDANAGRDAARVLGSDDLFALITVLEGTKDAAVASHALHLLAAALGLQPEEERIHLNRDQLSEASQRLTAEVCAHKHRLQDAAQYTLGEVLGRLLSGEGAKTDAETSIDALLASLGRCNDPGQCQVLLTVLSALAGRPRLLGVMAKGGKAREALLRFGQRAADTRLRARALSLIKVLNKEEHADGPSWYFGN